jgi:hypothetical protein
VKDLDVGEVMVSNPMEYIIILHRLNHHWPMGSFHVATSHWTSFAMCHQTIGTLRPANSSVEYTFQRIYHIILLFQVIDDVTMPHVTFWCCHVEPLFCMFLPNFDCS